MIYLPHKKSSLKKVLSYLKQFDKYTSYIWYKGWLITFSNDENIGILTGIHDLCIEDNELSLNQLSMHQIQKVKLAKVLNERERMKLISLIKDHYYAKHQIRASYDKLKDIIISYNEELLEYQLIHNLKNN